MLAQAVQARAVWKARAKPYILILEDDLCCRRVEKNLAALASDHREAKGVFLVFELELGGIATVSAASWAFKNSFRDLVDFVGRVLDLDVKALIFEAR